MGLTPLKLGLTGGIGSGKSTAASLLAEAGARIVDTDAIARQVTEGPALAAIQARFGCVVHGQLDRAALRAIVFADAAERCALEAILHPLIQAEADRQAQGHPLVVFDVPLLVESGRWPSRVDRVLVIDCDEEVQQRRVLARPGWTLAQFEGVRAAQASRSDRRAAADAVIDNSHLDLNALRAELRALMSLWRVEESRA